ncbi:LysR family transcriptional regulator [Sodalis ligni]|uniref:LysR family transcriptional regulator n=1 Tax=Sodalis ligni TaxID=2697027 RepID=UPI001BDE9B02|nr:LysR family transcriptional regulator [Sodalis ligni]QWA11678.1 LysR family transcriptional regulator [Sodalis ligni]
MTTIMEKTTGLVAFVRTVQNGSFASAGRIIGASPSAVSKSVARLEERLGVRLFQRSTRTLRLTVEGTDYYERVAPLLQAMEEAENHVQSNETPQGLIRISVPVLVGRVLMARWVAKFVLLYPRLKFDLDVTDRNVDIIREGFDLALRIGALPDSGLNARLLGYTDHILAASPAYLKRRGAPLTLDDLQHHDCLRFLIAGRPFPYAFAGGASIIPDGPLDTSDGATLRQAAVEGMGIIQIPRFAVADDIAAGTLIHVLPGFPMLVSPIHALHPFGRQLPIRARLFVDFLVEQFREKDTAS